LKETEAKVAAYEAANRSSIVANAARSSAESAALSKQEDLIRQQREQARLAAVKEEADEKYERERQKTDLIRDLASSEGSAEKILARNKAAALKRSSARRQNEEIRISGASSSALGMGIGSMEDVEEDEGPFDPLDGQGEESSLYKVHQNYDDSYVSLEAMLISDGWIQLKMIQLRWPGDLMCMMYIDEDYLKHTRVWDAYYLKS
jgi:CDK-activating kinase assembly factor MAT1